MAIKGYRYAIRVNGTIIDSTSIIDNCGELFLHYANTSADSDMVDLIDTVTGEILGKSTPSIEALDIVDYANCSDVVATFAPNQFGSLLTAIYGVPESCLN